MNRVAGMGHAALARGSTLLLLFMVHLSSAQTSQPAAKSVSDYTDGADQMCTRIRGEDGQGYSSTDCDNAVKAILDLDVPAYFGCEKCETPLQLKYYKQSADYREKLRDLTKMRKELLGKRLWFDATKQVSVDDYSVKRRGIPLTVDQGSFPRRLKDSPPATIRDFCFPSLPMRKIEDKETTAWQGEVLIPASEKIGLRVERAKDLKIVILFNVTRNGRYREETGYQEGSKVVWQKHRVICPIASKVTLLIADGDDVLVTQQFK